MSEYKSYAGIGARNTPHDVLRVMARIGSFLANEGYTLRSGGASGADKAFESGCDLAGGPKEIFLPWMGFNSHNSQLCQISPEAMRIAAQHHPNWGACGKAARLLHARNSLQILGADLNDPVEYVVCWTKGALGHGGTGQAIRIARSHGIDIIDLADPEELQRVLTIIPKE